MTPGQKGEKKIIIGELHEARWQVYSKVLMVTCGFSTLVRTFYIGPFNLLQPADLQLWQLPQPLGQCKTKPAASFLYNRGNDFYDYTSNCSALGFLT